MDFSFVLFSVVSRIFRVCGYKLRDVDGEDS